MSERLGKLPLEYRCPAENPSWWCRLVGHRFMTETARRGPVLEHVYRSCDRCGFTEMWRASGCVSGGTREGGDG